MTGAPHTPSRRWDLPVLSLALVAGALLGFCVLVGARIYSPRACELMLQTSVAAEPMGAFELVDLQGRRLESQDLAGTPYLLFFGDPGCPVCAGFYPALRQAQWLVRIVFVGGGDRQALAEMAEAQGFIFPVVADSTHELASRLDLAAVPAALLVDEEGVIRYKARAGGAAAALVEYARRTAADTAGTMGAPSSPTGESP